MNWQTDTVRSTFDATSNAINTMSNRESQRAGSTVGTFKKGGINLFGYNIGGKTTSNLPASSIVGMNVNQVETMRNAIEDYCLDIETYLRNLNPTAEAGIAFKSAAVTKALTTYMDNVKTYCLNLVSQLRAFSDKLADVKNQWEIATGNMAESIGSTSGDSFAMGSAYTRQVQSGGSSTGGSVSLGGAVAGTARIDALNLNYADNGKLYNENGEEISFEDAYKRFDDKYGAVPIGELGDVRISNGKILDADMRGNLVSGKTENFTDEFWDWINDPNAPAEWDWDTQGNWYRPYVMDAMNFNYADNGKLYNENGLEVSFEEAYKMFDDKYGAVPTGEFGDVRISNGKILDADMHGSLVSGKTENFTDEFWDWINDPNAPAEWDWDTQGDWWVRDI